MAEEFYGWAARSRQTGPSADGHRVKRGGDIQATTKVVDSRSLKSSPPGFTCVFVASPRTRMHTWVSTLVQCSVQS